MRKYIVQIIVFSLYAVFSAAWFSTSILTPEIAQELNINMQKSTLITNSIVLAKIFGAAFAGFLFYKFGLKKGYFIGSLFISAGIFMGYLDKFTFIDPFYLIVIIRFFTGLGSAVALAALVPIATKYFSKDKNLNMIITFNMNSNVIGSLVAFYFTTQIASYLGGWQNTLSLYGYINIALLILWLLVDIKDEKATIKDQQKGFKILKEVLGGRLLWAMVIYYVGPLVFLNSISLHVISYIKLELSNYIDKESVFALSKNIPSLISIIVVFSPFVGVWLKKRNINYKIMLVSISIALATGMMFIMFGGVFGLYVGTIIGGVFFGLIIPFLFSLPVELNQKPEFTGYIISGFWSISFVVLFINNQIIAYTYDMYKTYFYGFAYITILLLITPLALKLIKTKDLK